MGVLGLSYREAAGALDTQRDHDHDAALPSAEAHREPVMRRCSPPPEAGGGERSRQLVVNRVVHRSGTFRSYVQTSKCVFTGDAPLNAREAPPVAFLMPNLRPFV